MADGESLRNIGLHELTGEEIAAVVEFVDAYGHDEQRAMVQQEWQTLPWDHLDVTRAAVSGLANGSAYLKEFACKMVPYLAEQDSDTGFVIWQTLAGDETGEVRRAASDALIEHLGRLSLNPKGIVGLVQKIFEVERHYGE